MTRSAIRKLAIAILIFWPACCIKMHAEPSQEDQTTPFSAGEKIDQQSPATLSSLSKRAIQLYEAGEFAAAIPIAQECVRLAEKALGRNDPSTAIALKNLALLYEAMGEYAKAERLYQRALKICEERLAPHHPVTANTLNGLAELYREKGDYAKAEPLYQRALKIDEKALGPEHPDTARALNNLALLYRDMGDFAKAEPLSQRALKIEEKAFGPDHPHTAIVLSNLAGLYYLWGDYAKAEPLYQRALTIKERTLGPDHPSTATTLDNLALLYDAMGDYAKAEPLLQRALKIDERALGPNHPSTSTTLINLGGLYKAMGDHAKAELVYQRALNIDEKALGPDHPSTATSLNNLALFYTEEGDYEKAKPLQQRVLKIRERALGPTHPQTATALINLAVVYRFIGDFAAAEPLFQRALKIRENALGPDHPETATALKNLAALYHFSMGDYAKAEPLYQRALKISERALGSDHPQTATVLNDLALLQIDLGEAQDAIPFCRRARAAKEKRLANILSFTSEAQRLQFRQTTNPYSLLATLADAEALAQDVLRQKGIVLDSLLEDRLVAQASSDSRQGEIIEQLRADKQRLMQLVLEVPKDLSGAAKKKRAAEKERLSAEVEQLEVGLARQVTGLGKARRTLSVTVAQVQAAVPTQAVLVELLKYRHYLGKGAFESRYGAIMVGPADEPKWIPFGSAEEIDKNIVLYRKSTRNETDEAALRRVLKALQERVWTPLEKALPPGTARVIISPDAELSFVSFATLLTADDRFVGEKYSIRYVGSGRDLLRETKTTANARTSMRVFANPDFASNGNATHPRDEKMGKTALRSIEMRDLQSILLRNLPWTEKESVALEARAKQSGWQVQANLGLDATEAELRKVNLPCILHLATHGFFLPEIDIRMSSPAGDAAEIPKGKLVNPMHRSGVAMAGARTTLQAWARGEVPPTENDGIVTAEEVGALKLDGTWLVVLSACDTGSGEAKAGEGVMGLRRGFIQAGGQNLLMTLWPISDETTVNIMLDFYDAAFKSGNAPQALADIQRDWLVKLRNERGLLAAVQLAGPFIMSSQGRP